MSIAKAVRATLAGTAALLLALVLAPSVAGAESGRTGPVNGPGNLPKEVPTAAALEASGVSGFSITSITFGLPAPHSTGAEGVPTYSKNGYEGTINYSCSLIGEGQGSPNPAECAMYPSSAKLLVNGYVAPQILIFGQGTKVPAAPTTSASNKPSFTGVALGLALGGGLLFCIPARRRAWRNILSAMLVLVAMSSLSACVTEAKLITPGSYTFRVVGTDSSNPDISAAANVYINVK